MRKLEMQNPADRGEILSQLITDLDALTEEGFCEAMRVIAPCIALTKAWARLEPHTRNLHSIVTDYYVSCFLGSSQERP